MSIETTPAQPAAGVASKGYGSPSYRAYVLGLLLVLYTFNFIDRIVVGVVQEPIKEELGLQDWQLGILGGPAFALLYTLLGIPIARYAERASRINIISIAVAVWSAMTAACGVAGVYWQLLAARLGVSIGEAGLTPPAHSMIADYFPPERRASALSIYALGIPIGSALAYLGAGWLAQTFNWRVAFLVLGLPGLALAILARFTIKEPPRRSTHEAPRFFPAMAQLLKKPTFLHVAFGGALVSFFGYGAAQFANSFLIRAFSFDILQASLVNGVFALTVVAFGTWLGGPLVDRLRLRDLRWLTWTPAIGLLVGTPLYALGYTAATPTIALTFLGMGAILHYIYLGPMYAVTLGVADPRTRATASAVLLFIVNLIGYGLGPPVLGLLSNLYSDAFGPALGLRYALATHAGVMAWAALHFFLAARTLQRDLEPQ